MRRIGFVLALVLAACGGDDDEIGASARMNASAAIYDENTFATYSLTMSSADWDAIVANPGDSTWRRATMDWQGEAVSDVAVRPSGNTTRIPGNPKPSVRLDFNEFVPGRKWRNVSQINLDGLTRDRSFMRDRLAYEVFRRMGVPAPRSSHSRVVVNGVYKGVYEVEEPIKKSFLEHWWRENDGKLYRPDRINPYIYRGTDPASYVPLPYEPQTDPTVGTDEPVVTLCSILNNTPAAQRRAELEAQVMNVEGLLLYLAASNAMVDFDNANGFFGPHNHYWYHRMATGKFEIIAWDPEMTFGGIGGLIWFLGLPGENMWVRFGNSALTSWIPGDAVARASYKAKVQNVIDGPFATLPARVDFIYNQIKDAVYADPHKPMPNAEFDAAPQAIKTWITSRTASLVTQLAAP